ncbi:MAG: anion permease, partial [Lachnospiraceae bacterium]|nr:anion permease [Lachnospiraceae bacterium]
MTISFVLAIISMIFVGPDKDYSGYIDFRVLAILFCLMLLVKCFQSIGFMEYIIEKIFGRVSNSRTMCQILIFLCFFVSMIMTNDVALITFVPLAVMTLHTVKKKDLLIKVVVLQTIAANLGSMCTPIGNPQNLYLFSVSGMDIISFFRIMLPLTIVSFIGIYICTLTIKRETVTVDTSHYNETGTMKLFDMIVLAALFTINILVV